MASIPRSLSFVHFKRGRRGRRTAATLTEPVPDVFRTTFYHTQTHNLTITAAEFNYLTLYRINSINDPSWSSGGTAAIGAKSLGRLYQYYFVRKCWIRARLFGAGQVQDTGLNLVMIPVANDSSIPTSVATFDAIRMHYPRGRFWRRYAPSNATDVARTSSFTPWEFTQVGNPYDDPNNFGTLPGTGNGTNPTNFYAVAVGLARNNDAWTESGLTVTMNIDVIYDTYLIRQPNTYVLTGYANSFIPYDTWIANEGFEEADDDPLPTYIERDTTPTGAAADMTGHTDDP